MTKEGAKRLNSRAKGKSRDNGEPALRNLLLDRDWQVFPRQRGEAGDDFTAIDTLSRVWSVECKNTVSLLFSHYTQCKDNCGGKNRMLAWHPSKWGFPRGSFVVFLWPKGGQVGVHLWRAKP